MAVPREPTLEEEKAIRSLERVARNWPRTLTLASMGGRLCVVYNFDGIPNTGGDW